jgi:hypothetical protein
VAERGQVNPGSLRGIPDVLVRMHVHDVFAVRRYKCHRERRGIGAHISILRKHMACCFIPIADEGAYRPVGVVQLKQHFRSRSQRAFLRHLQETTRDQAGHLRIA